MPVTIIGENNKPPTFTIDDYSFYVQNGVTDISIKHRDHYGWDITCSDIEDSEIEQYYYYIDGIYNDVFPHWTLESSIYLHVFDKLKERYPTIKILSFRNKNYKNIGYQAYNIHESLVVNKIESIKNKVIFIKCCSQADHTECELYISHVRRWYDYLKLQRPVLEKDIDILYLPRGNTENSRHISELSILQSHLVPIISQLPGAKVYYTDTQTKNIVDQVELIRRAKIILLNEGGNHGVNGFFAENSHILVLGGNGAGGGYHFQNPRPALIYYDSLKRGNLYYHISYSTSVSTIIDLMENVRKGLINPYIAPAVNCWREDWKGCNTCNEKKWRYPESLCELDEKK
jgi:hypothetical protein